MRVCIACGSEPKGRIYLMNGKYICIKCINTPSYNFPEFSTKVISRSDDKSSSEGIEPKHNED